MARQQVNTNLPSDQLQSTTQLTQLNLQGAKPSKTQTFLKELQGVGQGVGDFLTSVQQISQTNTQRELAEIATEKRVAAEARQELRARLSLKKQQIAEQEAKDRKANAAAEKARKEAEKAAKEAQSIANEKAEVRLMLAANGGKDLSQSGDSVRQRINAGDREGAQGLSDISISIARKRAKQQVDAERKTLTPDQINQYNVQERYDELFNTNLDSMGFDLDTIIETASPDAVNKALNDRFESEEDLINDKITIRKQQMTDAADAMVGAHSVNMRGEIATGGDNPLGNFINKVGNPSNTAQVDYSLDEVRDAAVGAIGTYAQELISDPSIDAKQGQALIDSLVGKARAAGEPIVDTDEFKRSVNTMKKRLASAKSESSVKTSVNQAASINTLRNQNTPEETIAYATNTYGVAPGPDGKYTVNQLPLMSVDGEPVTPSMLKTINTVTQKAIDDYFDQSKVNSGIATSIRTGKVVKDSYGGVAVTQKAIRETTNLMVTNEDGTINPSRVSAVYLTGSMSDKPFTPEIKQYYSMDLSSNDSMISSINRYKELEQLGGTELVKWKLGPKDIQLKTDVDYLLRNNPTAVNDPEALSEIRSSLMQGDVDSSENQQFKNQFYASTEVKTQLEEVIQQEAIQRGLFGNDIEYDQVVNRQVLDSVMKEATMKYYDLNRGNPAGLEDYVVDYLSNNTFVDADTKELSRMPKNGNFSSADSMSKATNSAGDYVLNQGVKVSPQTRAAIEKNDETKFLTSGLVPGRLTANFKRNGLWVPVIDEQGRPVSIHVDDLPLVANEAEKNKQQKQKEERVNNVLDIGRTL